MRDERLDSIKGILIALVVWGHCFLYGSPNDSVKMVVANYVYLFHMPFFVFLSGYFTHVGSKSFWKGMLAIFESYIVFQVVKGSIQGYSLMDYLLIPSPMMWYLLALMIWRLIAYLLEKFQLSETTKYIVLAILVFGGLSVGFIDSIGKPLALSRIFVFAPFFWLGTILSGRDFVTVCKKLPKWLAFLILVFPIALVTFLTTFDVINVREIVRGASGYGNNDLVGLISRICLYVLAFSMSVSLTRVISESKLLSEVGRDSLKYYLFHGIALSAMVFLKLYWPWYMALIYGAFLMVVLFFFNKYKISDFAIRPVYFLLNNCKHGKSS